MHKVVWLYGLAGAGKSYLASRLETWFGAQVIDSDIFRHAWPELGWTELEKKERAARLLKVALAVPDDRVVVACITPYHESREAAREAGALLVHVVTNPTVCAERKPELYNKAVMLAGKDTPFQRTDPDLTVTGDDGFQGIGVKQVVDAAGWKVR